MLRGAAQTKAKETAEEVAATAAKEVAEEIMKEFFRSAEGVRFVREQLEEMHDLQENSVKPSEYMMNAIADFLEKKEGE